LLNRSADPLLTMASERGLAVLNAAPYGSGILAKGPAQYPRYAYSNAPAQMVERAKELEAICARYDVPLAAAALQFSLRDPRITATIVGMSRQEIPDACWDELLQVPYETGNPE
jgi:D-threo-aldose 1-dehydrogenase